MRDNYLTTLVIVSLGLGLLIKKGFRTG
jgi:hypothetical protein